MTFTYAINSLGTPLARVRLEIGDTDSASALFADEEINVKLASRADHVLLTAADLCDILAARFAQDVDVTEDGQSFKDSQKAAAYRAMAVRLRQRAVEDDVAAQDGAGLPIGRTPLRVPTTWTERW